MNETQAQETLATYTIQILCPEEEPAVSIGGRPIRGLTYSDLDKRVLADLPAMLEAVEEDLSDLLPEGFSAVIKEWNEE